MREMRIDKWCDLCLTEDRTARVAAVKPYLVDIVDLGGRPLTSAGRRPEPRVVEVCGPHADTLEAMRRVVSIGVTVERFKAMTGQASSSDGGEPEPFLAVAPPPPAEACEFCQRPIGDSSFIRHLYNSHGLKPIRQPKKCPDCHVRAEHHMGMMTHRRVVHDYDLRTELVAQLRARQPTLTDT